MQRHLVNRVLPLIAVCFIAALPVSAATLTTSTTAPTVDGADIASLTGSSDIGGDEGHIWANRPVQGQSFTTLGDPAGYILSAVTLQNLSTNTTTGNFTVRVGRVVDGNFLLMRSETTGGTSTTGGDYFTYTFDNPVGLGASGQYAFQVGVDGSGYVTANNLDSSSDVYTGGAAISSGDNSEPNDASIQTRAGDRVFHTDMTTGSIASSGLISVNFGDPLVNGEAGAAPHRDDRFNDFTAASGSGLTLHDSAGNANTAVLNYSAPNTWDTDNGATNTPTARLMKGYLDTPSTPSISLSVDGLDSTFTDRGYEVVVYADFDSAGTFGYRITDSLGNIVERWLRGGDDSEDFPAAGFVESTADNEADALSGPVTTYAVFEGLQGTDFTFEFLHGSNGDGRARINGFQIAAVPTPAALPAGLALLGLTAMRRKRR